MVDFLVTTLLGLLLDTVLCILIVCTPSLLLFGTLYIASMSHDQSKLRGMISVNVTLFLLIVSVVLSSEETTFREVAIFSYKSVLVWLLLYGAISFTEKCIRIGQEPDSLQIVNDH